MGEDRYKLIVARDHTEQYFRDMWSAAYCKQEIYTFDGIRVYFYDDNFDHAFYESTDRRQGINKSKRKMSYLCKDLRDSIGSRTYFVIQMQIYMLVMRVKPSPTHAARELLW